MSTRRSPHRGADDCQDDYEHNSSKKSSSSPPPTTQHTQFLDLTNGEGGELPSASKPAPTSSALRTTTIVNPEYDEDDEEVDGFGASSSSSSSHPKVKIAPSSDGGGGGGRIGGGTGLSVGAIDPSTPGKVVDSGQEHTGRWTKEEHEAFLNALKMYGKEWKKVAAKVKTRTVVQTRTHAQKYFQKLQKTMEQLGKEDITHVDMGVASETKKPSAQKKKQQQQQPLQQSQLQEQEQQQEQQEQQRISPPFLSMRRTSTATISAAQVISNLSSSRPVGSFVAAGSSSIMSGAAADDDQDDGGAVISSAATQQQHQQPSHGFSIDPTPVQSGGSSNGGADGDSRTLTTTTTTGGWMGRNTAMKIIAPDHDAMARKGNFPEPSPAATGKRKLAEIAAARMLAGVAGVPTGAIVGGGSAVDPDGPPTPPPLENKTFKHAPLLPLTESGFGDADNGRGKGGAAKGLSLQIVNPESLGVTLNARKRHADGEASPVTPWDGELQALVNKKARLDSKPDGNNGHDRGKAHPVCGPSTAFGRTELHKAVCDLDLETLQDRLGVETCRGDLEKLDDAGYAPIHTACSLSMDNLENASISKECVRLLMLAGADPERKDGEGNTPLHWAARAGDRDVAKALLVKYSSLDTRNKSGETPLHWAMRTGRRGMDVVVVLLDNGARPSVLDGNFRRALDVAGDGFLDDANSVAATRAKDAQSHGNKKMSREYKKAMKESALDRVDCRKNLLVRSQHSRSLVLHHPECLEHHPKSSSDWEVPDRTTSILKRIALSDESAESCIFPHEVTLSKEFERASLDLLSRVHSTEYLSFVNKLSKDLEKQIRDAAGPATSNGDGQASGDGGGSCGGAGGGAGTASSPPVVPFTPLVQRSIVKFENTSVKLGVNSDTSFSAGSLRAARRAAGAVQHAVDCVLVGRSRNAFCVVRPPGHHAGINGLLEGGESCGFCIFNNVAAGALYAISEERLLCDRCAIVDIDVHHGNGTEEIVRNCHDPSKLFFFSIHLYDNDKKKRSGNQFVYKFYPGTGSEDDLALNIINVPILPLWKEQPPAPAPVKTHNTRHKVRTSQEPQDDSSAEAAASRDSSSRGSDNNAAEGGSGGGAHASTPALSGRLAYRQSVLNRLLPALRAFNPDLILISAGFDAARGDVGNARHERGGQRMGLDLEPEDYAWTTRKILEIADICCQGRVVSVLEGGYGKTKPPSGNTVAAACTDDNEAGLDRTLFAECAVRHLHALIDPYDTECRFAT